MKGQSEAAPEPSDVVLVARVLGGEEQALSILYRRHVMAIYRFILAQVSEVEDAEDLTAGYVCPHAARLGGLPGRGILSQLAVSDRTQRSAQSSSQRQLPADGNRSRPGSRRAPMRRTRTRRTRRRRSRTRRMSWRCCSPTARYRQVLELVSCRTQHRRHDRANGYQRRQR